ncbi:hypothetical protein AAFF_G00057930 [Aldrovandia affinis]|uniref:Uncharacterized protein n=1 Tax=Aldrovandia affinis TaxID=143900 RepID=A0AAD7S0Q9_9TELE|nr:hypothetical protein AAFF_G00057930 [Aldrovandia affinis]
MGGARIYVQCWSQEPCQNPQVPETINQTLKSDANVTASGLGSALAFEEDGISRGEKRADGSRKRQRFAPLSHAGGVTPHHKERGAHASPASLDEHRQRKPKPFYFSEFVTPAASGKRTSSNVP